MVLLSGSNTQHPFRISRGCVPHDWRAWTMSLFFQVPTPDEKTVDIHVFFIITAGGLLVPDGMIIPVVSGSAQTWFIR